MSENLGSIRYDVSVETANTLKAEAVVNKSVTNIAKDFDRADIAVKSFTKAQEALGSKVNSSGQVINKNGEIVAGATKRYRELADTANSAFTRLETAANKSTKTLNSQMTQVAKSTKGASFQAANFSYQIQDIAVQAQMGTSPLVIFAQQFPQMAVGMGAAAAGIGAAVAILGALGTALIDTKTDADKLNKVIERTKAVLTLSSGGVVEYTEHMQQLGKISEEVAKYKIKLAMEDAAKGVKNAVNAMGDSLAEVDDRFAGIGFEFAINNDDILDTQPLRDYTVNIGNLLGEVGSSYDRTGDKAQEMGAKFIRLFSQLKTVKTPEEVTEIQKQIIEMANATGKADKKFKEMIDTLILAKDGTEDYFTKLRVLVGVIQEGSKGYQDFSNKTNELNSAFKDSIKQLSLQNVLLKDGERAAYAASLTADGFTQSQINAQLAIYDANKALEDDNEEKENAIKKNEDYKKSIDDVNSSLDAFFDKESSDSTKKDDQRKATLTTQVQSIGLTPLEQIEAQYQAEKAALEKAEADKIEIIGTYAERHKQIESEKQEAIKELQGGTNQFLADAFGNLDTQIAGTMAQVVTGAKDGEDALRGLANTMLTQLIGAAVQYGVEMVKNQMLGNVLAASEKANILSTTATGVAAQQTATASTVTAAATTATAAAPAAALTSTFSFGSAALIGGAALLGTMAISKMMASSGGREFGGPVSAGSMYRVGEKGKPEFYKDNLGKLSMIPGENGEVIPADKMGGSGGGMTVQVNNYTPYQVYVTQDQATSIAKVEIGNEAGKLQKGRGSMYNAMKSGGNYSNNAKR